MEEEASILDSKNCQFSSYAVCMHQLIEQPVGFSKSIAKIIVIKQKYFIILPE